MHSKHNCATNRKLFLYFAILAIISISGIQYSYAQSFEHVLSFGSGDTVPFSNPTGITTTPTHIFIVDSSNNRVQIFDINGNYITQFGSGGNGTGEFNASVRITTNNIHLFVADTDNNRVQIFDINGNYVNQFGSVGSANGQFDSPFGITTNNTHLFVADTDNNRVQIFDINGNYLSQFGLSGTGDGQFNQPRGITTNSTHLFVSDSLNHRVQIFDINGQYVDQFGGTGPGTNGRGNGTGEFVFPYGITSTYPHIYVVDGNNHRVQIFDFNGNYVNQFGGTGTGVNNRGSGIGEFNLPRGIATNHTHIFVTDSLNSRAQIFEIPSSLLPEPCQADQVRNTFGICVMDTEPPIITVGGSSENRTITVTVDESYTLPAPTIFDNDPNYNIPVTVTINGTLFDVTTTFDTTSVGTFIVSYTAQPDARNNDPIPVVLTVNVNACPAGQIFNGTTCAIQQFEHVLSFGSGDSISFSNPVGIATTFTHIFIVVQDNNRVQIWDINGNYITQFGSNGTANGEFNVPVRITTNNTHLFVVDQGNNRVQIFDINGNYVNQFGSQGSANGEFTRPFGITTNNTHLFVADTDNHRVQIFDINGNYLSKFGLSGTGDGQFNQPRGITTNNTHLFVSDTLNHRVQIFDFNGNYAGQFGGTGPGTNGRGNGTGEFVFPYGITTTYTHLYVVDGNNHRVQVFDFNGNYVNQFGGTGTGVNNRGSGIGEFNLPRGIATNHTHIFVTDSLNSRAQIFEIPSSLLPESCIDRPVDNRTNCILDTIPPVITVSDDPKTFLVGATYDEPSAIVTDNDPVYSGTITVTPSTIDTSSPGTFPIRYTATADVAGNAPLPVVITILVSCPAGQVFIGNVCVVPSVEHVSSFGNSGSGNGKFDEPSGIATNNIHLFVTDTNNHRVQIFDITGSHVKSFGSSGTGNGSFDSPRGIATNNTHLFVSDLNNRIQIFDTMGNYVNQFGGNGTGNGEFRSPQGITTNNTHLFVADTDNHRVQIFDTNGKFVKLFGSQGNGNGEFDFPARITTTNTHIFVSDFSNHRVQIFDTNGNYVNQFGSQGNGTGQFSSPVGITTNKTHVFVADQGNHRVQIFDVMGNYVAQFGSEGSADDQFSFLRDILITNTRIFVADTGNNRIQIFDTCFSQTIDGICYQQLDNNAIGNKGTGVSQFDSPRGITTTDTHLFVADTDNHRIQIFDNAGNYASQFGSEGTGNGEFSSPIGITTNNIHLFVADANNHRVQVFNFNGTYVNQFGSNGAGNGQFDFPTGITTNNTHLFVADTRNNRVQIFDVNGNYVGQFGSMGSANGQFNNPVGIATNNTHLFVVDTGNHRIQIFDHSGNYVNQFGSEGNGNGQFDDPRGIALTDTRIFVADSDNHRIQIFDNMGNYVNQFGSQGNGTGEFRRPYAVATTSTYIFVADTFNHKLQVYNVCQDNQVRDRNAICYTPEPFEFTGLESAYFVGDSLTGSLSFINDITATSYVITDGALDDITLNSGGTWGDKILSDTHFGNHIVQITARYIVDGADRESISSFTFQVCQENQLYDANECIFPFKHILSLGRDDNVRFRHPIGIITTSTHIFVADHNNNRIQILDINGTYTNQFGSSGSANGQFNLPRGITTNNTHLFVTDTGNHRIQIFDINGNYVSQFGSEGSDNGQFIFPTGITTNNTHLFVVDTRNYRIQIFDINGNYVDQFGSLGNGAGEFTRPLGIITNNTHIFVVDQISNRIQIFDINGNYTGQFGSMGSANGQFDSPRAITATFTHLYVADANNHRVQVFNFNGTYVNQFGGSGTANGQFNTTRGITTNNTHLFVVDSTNHRVQIFALHSSFLPEPCQAGYVRNTLGICVIDDTIPIIPDGQLNSPRGIATTDTHVFVADTFNNRIQIFDSDGNYVDKFGSTGSGNGQFSSPTGIATNNTHLYVADRFNNRIQIFDINGNYTGQFGSLGSANGQFDSPRGIATNNTHLFVSDLNNRIQIFDVMGNYVDQFGSEGNGTGEFNVPRDIATNNTHLFVVDTGNHRIQIFDINGNYTGQFGSEGSGNAQVIFPRGITTNDTHIFVADTSNHRIQVFDNMGNYVYQFGSKGNGTGEFNNPFAVATTSTHIFVADTFNHRLQIFDLCQDNQIRDSNGVCYTPEPFEFTGLESVYVVGDSLTGTLSFINDITATSYVITDGALAGITLNSNGTWADEPLTNTHVGNHTISITATYQVNGTDRESVSSFTFQVCQEDQSFDGNVCYTSGEFTFIGLKNTYDVGETLSGQVRINATNATFTQSNNLFAVYPNGTLHDQVLNGTFLGSNTLTFNVDYMFENATRSSSSTFTFNVIDTEKPIITANPTTITLEIDETFTPPTVSVADNDPAYVGTITNTTAPSPVDTSNLGVFTITYNATADIAGNSPLPVTVTVNVTDTTAPIITASPPSITLQIGQPFTPPTIIVTDNDPDYVGTISNTTSPGPVDTSSIGNYTITYSATADASNNAPIPVEVTVNVTNCDADQILDSATNTCITDTTLPIITANPTSITLEIDETFTPPTVSVTDNDPAYVGTITNTTAPSIVDTSSIGVFTITYSATADVAGNSPLPVTVTVNVTDTTAPIITASPSTIVLQIGQPFTPPTIIVTDNDPDYVGTISNTTSPGPVDTSSIGNYTITYSATADASNNTPTPIMVTVTISGCDADQILDSATNTCITDTTLPIITANPTTITLEIDETFTPPTVSVTDNDPAYVGTITNTTVPSIVDTSSIGVFTITYSATADVAGNSPLPVTVTVNVTDTTAPIITANPPSITLQIGQPFTPPTIIVTDNDPDYVGTISNTTSPGPVDTSSIGNYTITYSATADASNNVPIPITVTVTISGCDADQILDSATNTCITDTTLPIITANPTTITLEIDETFTPPTVSVTDNDPAYVGTITNSTAPSPVDTSSIGSIYHNIFCNCGCCRQYT